MSTIDDDKNKCKEHNTMRCSYPHCECHPTTIGKIIKATMKAVKNKFRGK